MSHRKNTRSSSKASTAKPARYFHIAFLPLYKSLNHVFRGGRGSRGGRGGRGGRASASKPKPSSSEVIEVDNTSSGEESVQ